MPRRNPHIQLPPNPSEHVVSPKKKALLIGINNTLMDGGNDGSRLRLSMPHKDVDAMRTLLIDHYNYKPSDIVTLVDKDDPRQLPTGANIRTEMRNLVSDARRGDRFFFHYSGHVVQTENKDGTEEDGQDECLVPCDSDGVQNLVKDDELRSVLVDRLPRGCQLVAVLDSCHSGSLLDLEHYRCNRVWVPWISKGRRRSDPIRNNVIRHNAMIVYQHKRISDDRVKERKTTVPNYPSSPLASARRGSSHEIPTAPVSPVASPTVSPAATSTHKKLARALTKLENNTAKGINAVRRSSTWKSSGPAGQPVKKIQRSRTIKSQFVPWFIDIKNPEVAALSSEANDHQEYRVCESPVQEFCSGWCHHNLSPTSPTSPNPLGMGPPQIISLASCKDSQEAWEDPKGHSMTQRLVEILKQDPHPTMSDLMVTISHKLHDAAIKAHTQTKKYKNKAVLYRKKHPDSIPPEEGDTEGLNLNDFQDPQLSSQNPLDMGRRWEI
ncbi:peptidase C14, caspase domain-containing protein [Lentinula raphanica]|uniref:Peptidase C14, caspase domain-containing protein n=1 Tax=Lentinula raphanica TaxID=153919 RepID=A0AA38PIQ0_9AGAR|nr:peptidase C14, caspase domain-containing protein [Lentinula raphanica]